MRRGASSWKAGVARFEQTCGDRWISDWFYTSSLRDIDASCGDIGFLPELSRYAQAAESSLPCYENGLRMSGSSTHPHPLLRLCFY